MNFFTSNNHDHAGESVWEQTWELLTDPAHLLFELIFTIGFDLIIVFLLWGVVVKKIIIPKLRKDIHEEIDAEHGYTHEDDDDGKCSLER